MVSSCILIPARLNSSRLEKKLLLKINKFNAIQNTYLQCIKSMVDYICVITDSQLIYNSIQEINGNCIIINKEYTNGTERIADALQFIDKKFDIIINVQGDQLFINPKHINEGLISFKKYYSMCEYPYQTLYYSEIINNNYLDTSKVKLVLNNNKDIIYYSRNNIPYNYNQDHKNILLNISVGVYYFTPKSLLHYNKLPQTTLQSIENIEQLKIIENSLVLKGIKIKKINKNDFFDLNTKKDYINILNEVNQSI